MCIKSNYDLIYFIEMCNLYFFIFRAYSFIFINIIQFSSSNYRDFLKNDNGRDEEISKLKEEIKKLNLTITQQKQKIDELENKLKKHQNIIQSLEDIISSNPNNDKINNSLQKVIYDLKNIYTPTVDVNQLMCINFTSNDQTINYSIPCLKSDVFAVIEEKLYQEYPEKRETNNYFLCQGNQILRFKTIAQNKIKSGFPVILNTEE